MGLRTVLADAGFDSEANHRIARQDMGVRSLIKTGVGRVSVSGKPPAGRYRRRMKWELNGSQQGKPFGQRAQAETVMSMLKRNLGDALRARTPRTRIAEHLFKAVVPQPDAGDASIQEGRDRAGRESYQRLPTP